MGYLSKTIIMFFLMLFTSFNTIAKIYKGGYNCQTPDSTVSYLLQKAAETGSVSYFMTFLQEYGKMDKNDQLKFSIKEKNLSQILTFERKRFQLSLDDSTIIVHIKVRDFFKDNAEYSEIVDEAFADFFIKDLDKSLKTLENINDIEIVNQAIQSIVFKEGVADTILTYMENKGLTDMRVYKLFLEYR